MFDLNGRRFSSLLACGPSRPGDQSFCAVPTDSLGEVTSVPAIDSWARIECGRQEIEAGKNQRGDDDPGKEKCRSKIRRS
jgi:hypothetical protein